MFTTGLAFPFGVLGERGDPALGDDEFALPPPTSRILRRAEGDPGKGCSGTPRIDGGAFPRRPFPTEPPPPPASSFTFLKKRDPDLRFALARLGPRGVGSSKLSDREGAGLVENWWGGPLLPRNWRSLPPGGENTRGGLGRIGISAEFTPPEEKRGGCDAGSGSCGMDASGCAMREEEKSWSKNECADLKEEGLVAIPCGGAGAANGGEPKGCCWLGVPKNEGAG